MKRLFCLALCALLFIVSCLAEGLPLADFSDAWADRFLPAGSVPERTDTGYRSDSLSVTVRSFRYLSSDVYVADIYIKDLHRLRRGFGGGAWGKKSQTISRIAEAEGAVLALSGDNSQVLSQGAAFGNGELLRRTTNRKRQLCLIMNDGEMRILEGKEVSKEDILALSGQVWQSFLFGPALLDGQGGALTEFVSGVKPANPRAVIGYYAPGHYAFVLVDGRGTKSLIESGQKNKGLTMKELSALAEELGFTQAYNLDGGQSASVWFNGRVLSNPYHGGRAIGDILYLTEP